jgi:nitrite reductase/ring-hydroxylating ferredoxin subunit
MKRRVFLKRLAYGLGALVAAVLGGLGLAFLVDRRSRLTAKGAFQRVARLSELEVGQPKLVEVYDVRPGDWSLFPPKEVGRVWLVRRDGDAVDAYSARCPHRGGSIRFDGKRFVCPSHGACFDLTCHRLSKTDRGNPNPAPRDMDALETRQAPDPAGGDALVEVRYLEFLVGVAERQTVS